MEIEEFHRLVEEVSEEVPEELFRELNGGILVVPAVEYHPEAGGTYILGEYHVDEPGLGRYIVLYHGSFLEVLGPDASEQEFREEIWDTLLHEFRHHLESLAGMADLEVEDELALEQMESRRGSAGG